MTTKLAGYLRSSLIFSMGEQWQQDSRRLKNELQRKGFSLTEALILLALFFEKKPHCLLPSVLADLFQTSRSNISHAITRLEKAGLLKRLLNHQDARSYRIQLLPLGKQRTTSLIAIFERLEAAFDAKLGSRKKDFAEILAHLATHSARQH